MLDPLDQSDSFGLLPSPRERMFPAPAFTTAGTIEAVHDGRETYTLRNGGLAVVTPSSRIFRRPAALA